MTVTWSAAHNTHAVYSILNATDSAATKRCFHAFVVLAVYSREFGFGLKESGTPGKHRHQNLGGRKLSNKSDAS